MTPPNEQTGIVVSEVDLARRTRRAFLRWAFGLGAGAGGIAWIRTREQENGVPWPLRRAQQANEWVSRQLFSSSGRVREFSPDQAGEPRVNGTIGWPDQATGQIRIEIPEQPHRILTLNELVNGLPRVEETTELKCIEGWSQIVTWAGVRFADAVTRLGIRKEQFPYVGLTSAQDSQGRSYYVGLDTASAFHPQTLLCDSMNGTPLPESHGGPLRLIIPMKYGIKNIKWLAQVQFASERPADYWHERGYDWYAGL